MVIEQLTKFDLYLGMAIAGIFTGLGSAIGAYIANKGIIEKFKKLKKNLTRRQNGG